MNLFSILIAACLSVLVVISGIDWYCVVARQFKLQSAKQDELNLMITSFQFMVRDIQKSGYRGCRTLDPNFPLYRLYNENNPKYRYLRFDRAVQGFIAEVGACNGKLPMETCNKIKPNSDVLIVYNIPQKITSLAKAMESPSADILVQEKPQIWENSLVLIADCYQGDVFVTSGITGMDKKTILHDSLALNNKSNDLSKAYGTTAEVTELQTVAYYLRIPEHHQNKNLPENKLYSLYRDDLIHKANDIASNVSGLSFEYGFLNPKEHKLQYRKAEAIAETEWQWVSTIKIKIAREDKEVWTHEISLRNGYGTYFGNGNA